MHTAPLLPQEQLRPAGTFEQDSVQGTAQSLEMKRKEVPVLSELISTLSFRASVFTPDRVSTAPPQNPQSPPSPLIPGVFTPTHLTLQSQLEMPSRCSCSIYILSLLRKTQPALLKENSFFFFFFITGKNKSCNKLLHVIIHT